MAHHCIVPDASVILKWVLHFSSDEQDSERALMLRQGWIEERYEIIVPGIWLYEVANIIGCKFPAFAGDLVETLMEYPFTIVKIDGGLCRQAFTLMQQWKVAFYDAIYHSTALQYNGLYVTADENYFKRAKSGGNIILLRDLPL